jgi:prepilin-type N-terminal cleavage/methylation domain-containing protein
VRSRRDLKNKNLIQQGFTLVELLVVIVILGVLAAVVVFAVGGITNTSKKSACTIEVRTINTATQAFYAQQNRYPTAVEAPTGAGLITFLQSTAGLNLLSAGVGSSSAGPPVATYAPATGVYAATCPA